MSRTAAAFICLLCGVAASADAQKPPRIVQGWAAFIQSVQALDEYVATGELSSIHNEDATLADVISVLKAEAAQVPAARQRQLVDDLTAFGRQLGDVHQSADSFDAPETKVRFKKLMATYTRLKGFYGPETHAAASRLAAVHACPMHRDVKGKRTDICPKCGMRLDQPVKVPLLFFGLAPQRTIRAAIQAGGSLEPGRALDAVLRLNRIGGGPILITDLRVVHTERIHLLIVDPSLTDYHHVHPQPTAVPGEYAFSFTPARPGTYRAWADLRTTYGGFQEYATTDIRAATKPMALTDRGVKLDARLDGLRYALVLERPDIAVGDPVRLRLRVTDDAGRPFTRLEPVMGAFAHLVAFHENWKTVLHLHPRATKAVRPTDRGGPELEFQLYATEPGYYRLFAQVQIKGASKFVPFGLTVVRRAASTEPARSGT